MFWNMLKIIAAVVFAIYGFLAFTQMISLLIGDFPWNEMAMAFSIMCIIGLNAIYFYADKLPNAKRDRFNAIALCFGWLALFLAAGRITVLSDGLATSSAGLAIALGMRLFSPSPSWSIAAICKSRSQTTQRDWVHLFWGLVTWCVVVAVVCLIWDSSKATQPEIIACIIIFGLSWTLLDANSINDFFHNR